MNAEKHADFAVPNILKSVTTNHLKPARLGIGIVSAGKVGAVLGAALRSAGHAIVGVRAESDASAERAENLLPGIPMLPTEQIIERSELVLLAVPDDALQPVIEGIAAGGMVSPGQDASDQETIRGGRVRARQHTARRASGRREWQSIIADQESGAIEQAPSRPEPPDNDSRDLLTVLAASPMSAEALASRLGWPIDRILITIQLLELGGYIGRHVDGRWQRLD